MSFPAPVQALVLSGGGAHAAYEIGVLKALVSGAAPPEKKPVDPRIYCGTSAGAFNAALMVSLPDSDERAAVARCEEVWRSSLAGCGRYLESGAYRVRCNFLDVITASARGGSVVKKAASWVEDCVFIAREAAQRVAGFARWSSPLDERFSDLIDTSAIFETSPMEETIRKYIVCDELRRSRRSLFIAATNWTTGRLRVFGKDDFAAFNLHELILASSALPGIFPPVTIKGQLYQDGGVVMLTPLNPAIEAGADVIHAVYMDPDLQLTPSRKIRTSLDVVNRALGINAASIMNNDIERAAQVNRSVTFGARYPSVTPEMILELEGRPPNSSPHRALTIHRYHPKEDFGGILGALDFSLTNIERLIEKGFEDASKHECGKAGCVLPSS